MKIEVLNEYNIVVGVSKFIDFILNISDVFINLIVLIAFDLI